MIAGKVMMDRMRLIIYLIHENSYADSKELIEEWHGKIGCYSGNT